MDYLAAVFGLLVGFTLGLTGGGGAILAVPLLVYGLGIPSKDAVGVSLLAVGLAAAVGCFIRWRRGHLAVGTGLVFAAAGMLCTPLGAKLTAALSETWHLGAFAGLMLIVAWLMWRKAGAPGKSINSEVAAAWGPSKLQHWGILASLGCLVGLLSGLFGVGGGFIIVPALTLVAGMGIETAIGTSMLVIACVSVTGVLNHHLNGRDLHLDVAVWFILGSLAGLFGGTWLGSRLSGPMLQRLFALVVLFVGSFVLLQVLTKT